MSAPTYVRSGRGGAGNFAPKTAKPQEVEMQPKPVPIDVEAQQPSDPADATSVIDAPSNTSAPQYKTYARGGAGNWYEPAALKETGTFTSNPAPTESSNAEKRSSRVWQGRGGAGNWEADQHMKEEMKRRSLAAHTDDEALAATLHEIKKEAKVEAEKEIQQPKSAHVHVPHLDKHQNLGDEVHDI